MDALDILVDTLRNLYGYDQATAQSLANRLWGEHVEGLQGPALEQWIFTQPEFEQRFPGLNQLRESGRAVSPAAWIAYERQFVGMARAAGLPPSFYDTPEDIGQFITNEVSIVEAQQRIQMAQQAVYDEFDVAAAQTYGLEPGDLAAMLLDPTKAEPIVERKFRAVQNAKIAGQTAFGQLSAAEAERVALASSSPEQVRQGFSDLAGKREVFQSLDAGEDTISTDEQLAAQFEGDAVAQEKIRARQSRRVAEFSQGGGFSQGQRGYSGIG